MYLIRFLTTLAIMLAIGIVFGMGLISLALHTGRALSSVLRDMPGLCG